MTASFHSVLRGNFSTFLRSSTHTLIALLQAFQWPSLPDALPCSSHFCPKWWGRPWPQSPIWPLESPEALLPGREGFHGYTVPARPPEGPLPWLNSGQAVMRPKGGILLTQPLDAPTASSFRSHSRLQTPKAPHLHPWAPETLGHSLSLPKKLLGVPPCSPRSPTLPFPGAPRGQAPLPQVLGGPFGVKTPHHALLLGDSSQTPQAENPGLDSVEPRRPGPDGKSEQAPGPGRRGTNGPAVPPAPRRRRRAREGAVASSTLLSVPDRASQVPAWRPRGSRLARGASGGMGPQPHSLFPSAQTDPRFHPFVTAPGTQRPPARPCYGERRGPIPAPPALRFPKLLGSEAAAVQGPPPATANPCRPGWAPVGSRGVQSSRSLSPSLRGAAEASPRPCSPRAPAGAIPPLPHACRCLPRPRGRPPAAQARGPQRGSRSRCYHHHHHHRNRAQSHPRLVRPRPAAREIVPGAPPPSGCGLGGSGRDVAARVDPPGPLNLRPPGRGGRQVLGFGAPTQISQEPGPGWEGGRAPLEGCCGLGVPDGLS